MNTSDFKKGLAVKYNGETYVITGYQFVNPGKGSAFTRTKLKNVKTGKVVEVSFRSNETIDEANMEYKKCQYMYNTGDSYSFMDNVSYDQFEISADVIGNMSNYLIEGGDVTVVFVDDLAVGVQLPAKMSFKVVEAPPGEKGDTATGGSKFVVIETGASVNVPLFIKEGDRIKVNTESGEYVERDNS